MRKQSNQVSSALPQFASFPFGVLPESKREKFAILEVVDACDQEETPLPKLEKQRAQRGLWPFRFAAKAIPMANATRQIASPANAAAGLSIISFDLLTISLKTDCGISTAVQIPNEIRSKCSRSFTSSSNSCRRFLVNSRCSCF